MGKTVHLAFPVNGEGMPLSEVNDYLFNKKIMGEGIAIKPIDNYIYSPVDGEISVLYDTRHAVIIKTEEGLQILIHVGIDSVKLEGRGFGSYVKAGDKVKKGEKILFFDREYIERRASIVTPMVITNSELIETIEINYSASKVGDKLIDINLK